MPNPLPSSAFQRNFKTVLGQILIQLVGASDRELVIYILYMISTQLKINSQFQPQIFFFSTSHLRDEIPLGLRSG